MPPRQPAPLGRRHTYLYLSTTSATDRSFDGRIDEAAIYPYVLPAAVVASHVGERATYTYDAAYELTSVTYPDAVTDTYTYDAMGTRLTKNSTSYTYNAADRMLTAGGTSYGYDNNGNQTGRGSDTFGWDHENRRTSTSIGGTSGTYAYNGDGLRASRTIGGSTVSYRWDAASGLPVILQDSASNTYVYGLDLISRADICTQKLNRTPVALPTTTQMEISAARRRWTMTGRAETTTKKCRPLQTRSTKGRFGTIRYFTTATQQPENSWRRPGCRPTRSLVGGLQVGARSCYRDVAFNVGRRDIGARRSRLF